MSPTAICALYEFVCFSMSLVQTPVYVQYRLLLENVVETSVCVSSSRYVWPQEAPPHPPRAQPNATSSSIFRQIADLGTFLEIQPQ